MEPLNNEPESVIAPLKKVTPFSKYLAMLLFISMPFLGGWIGYTYAPEKVVGVEEVIFQTTEDAVRAKLADMIDEEGRLKAPVAETEGDSQSDTMGGDIAIDYHLSSFRTVAVLHNPYYPDDTKYDSVVVVSPRGINDYSCGGKYVPSKCYIFLESSYAETETPKFVGVWTGGAINPKTLRFVSPNEILIDTGFHDACINVKAASIYDLNTGSSTIETYEDLSSGC